jgi:surface antigen
MTVALAAPAGECQLVASASGRAPQTLSKVRPMGHRVTWIWQVPGSARSATWLLVASCGSSTVGAVITVHGHRSRGPLSLARRVRALQYVGASDLPAAAQVKRAAMAWWASNSSSILSAVRGGRSAGQCTAYAATRRPDIIERVDTWAYSRHLLAGGGGLDVNWNAEYWDANARRAGMKVGTVPRPSAVIVFQPGAYGATALGHVAYVDAVGRDGSFTISEMHAPVLGRVTSRHFDARAARAIATGTGVTFIYR